MKTYKNLYRKICDKDYIRDVLIEASSNKPYKAVVEKNLTTIVERAYTNLVNETVEMLPTQSKVVHDRKKDRNITLSRFFPNKTYDYLLVSQLKPIIEKSMYYYCVGNVKGRGLDKCLSYVKEAVKHYSYCWQGDIKKFYESIDKEILYHQVERRVSDKAFMNFYGKVVGRKGKGISLGLNSSQWLSNFHLQEFDYYVKQVLKVQCYIRYVDNIWIFENNIRKVHYYYKMIRKFLWEKLKLQLKGNYQILNIDKGDEIDCVGYRVTRQFTRLNKDSLYKIARLYWRMKDHSKRRARTIISLYGWLKRSTNYVRYLYTKLISKVGISLDEIKQLTRRKNLCKTLEQSLIANS